MKQLDEQRELFMKEIELHRKEGQMLRKTRINSWLQKKQLEDTDSSEDQDSDYSTKVKDTNMTTNQKDFLEIHPGNQMNFSQRLEKENVVPKDHHSRLRDKGNFLKNKEAVCIQYILPSSDNVPADLTNSLKKEDQCTDVISAYNYAHKITTFPSASIPRYAPLLG